MAPSAEEATSKSGIVTLATGERQIPASQRADGSHRKEIKIRPGYRPPEDIETYKNRTAQAWRTRGSNGVPGAASVSGDGGKDAGMSKASSKNAKRREARKKAKAGTMAEDEGDRDAEDGAESRAKAEAQEKNEEEEEGRVEPNGVQGDAVDAVRGWQQFASSNQPTDGKMEGTTEKQARRVQKKLRQARELKEKQDGGQMLQPEQREKVESIDQLVRQLEQLGGDGEGKPTTG